MGFHVIDFINKKMAGMALLCNVIAKDLEGKAKQGAKWTDRTSHGRGGIAGDSTGGDNNYNINLSYGVDYGGVLEEGSPAHIITPKNAKALYWKGAAHPVKRVNHPGTEGFHTLENTFKENKSTVTSTIKEYWGS